MQAPRLLCSCSAAARLDGAIQWLQHQNPSSELLLIGATVGAVSRLAHQAAPVAFGWSRHTLDSLARTLAVTRLAEEGLLPASRLTLEATLTRVVRSGDALGRFAPVAEEPGLPRALLATLDQVRMTGTRPADPDLAILLDRYEDALRQYGYADRTRVFETALACLESSAASHPVLLLDVPIRWPLEAKLVRRLAAVSSNLLATVPSGDPVTLAHLDPLEVEAVSPPPSPLGLLQSQLFASQVEPIPDCPITFLTAPGVSRECVEIARHLIGHAHAGVPLEQIAIALRAPERYRDALSEALERADLPACFSRGTRSPDPTGNAFLALLRCARENLSARRFAEYVSMGELPDSADAKPPAASPDTEHWVSPEDELLDALMRGEPLDDLTLEVSSDSADARIAGGTLQTLYRWEDVLVETAVLGGLERWRARLHGAMNSLDQSLQRYPDDSGHLARRKADIASLASFALPLLEDLSTLPSHSTWGAWLTALSRLATRSLRQPRRVLELLSSLQPMADIGPVDLEEVLATLEPHLTTTPLPAPSRHGRIWIGTPDELRSQSFSVVAVPGLNERVFPARDREDPLLLDRERDPPLPRRAERLAEEQLALRLAVGAATVAVCASWSTLDTGRGRATEPSGFALELIRAVDGSLPSSPRIAECVQSPQPDWPAPLDPQDAIDDAEFDLAALRARWRDPAPRQGALRYLFDVNPHIARALRARWSLDRTHAPSSHDGLFMATDASRAFLEPHRVLKRAYSATALQTFAACPQRFYLAQILRLTPREMPEPVLELDPLQRGNLVHEALFHTLTTLRERGLFPLVDHLTEALAVFEETFDATAAKHASTLAPAVPRIWSAQMRTLRRELSYYLVQLARDREWTPTYFELSFGLSERVDQLRDAASHEEPARLPNGLRLRGAIDLVEVHADGRLRATDYKTGKARLDERGVTARGAILQPTLYPLALAALMPERDVAGGRLAYCTKRGEFTNRDVALDGRAREAVDTLVAGLEAHLQGGYLPAVPQPGACATCDFAAVCDPDAQERGRALPLESNLKSTRRHR